MGLVTTPYSLASGTVYYYQPVFYNTSNNSTVYGPVQQFTTLATPVTTVGARTVTSCNPHRHRKSWRGDWSCIFSVRHQSIVYQQHL